MPIVRTAVILAGFPAGQKLSLQDVHWYVKYFFSPTHGQSAYWLKQSSNDIVIDGEVFDWAFFTDPNPDLSSREAVINRVIGAMENDRGADFGSFDVVVAVLGVPDSVKSDGGSSGASSKNRQHHGIVTRVKDRFDFVAHELGHAIQLDHSFGSPQFKTDGEGPGGYGHPYCVMSAMAYGGIGGAFVPTSPRDGRLEYTGLGPSLNAASALGRGWVDAHVYQVPGAPPAEFELRSRHWMGKDPGLAPQALNVKAPDGNNYVLEFRENAGWDEGQDAPMLILNHGVGSTADVAHPGTHSARYLRLIRLPITFGAPGSVINGPGFGVQVIDRSGSAHTVRVRIRPGAVSTTDVELSSETTTRPPAVLETGSTTWEQGEKLCVEGTWAYEKLANTQVVTCDATYTAATPPLAGVWSVDGVTLADTAGSVTLPKTVLVANPKLAEVEANTSVVVEYAIESLPAGSRLRLTNRPNDETYQLDVGVTLSSTVGSAIKTQSVYFTGIEYRYEPGFYEARDRCVNNFREIGKRYSKSKVVLEPDLWDRIPPHLVEEVDQLLEVLGYLHDKEDQRGYQQGVAELTRLVGGLAVKPMVMSLDARLDIRPPEAPISPPAPVSVGP